jgi:hypothetical protein
MTENSRNTLLAVPLILINAAALYGQASWSSANLTHSWPWALVLAAALEGVGVFLAAEAHHARMAGEAALRLRLGSYGVAGVVGLANFLHWRAAGVPAGATFGLLSASSPWLWAIRSRSLRRGELRNAGLIDPRAVRFSLVRWMLYPARTFKAFRAAVWVGETDPVAAIRLAEPTAPSASVVQPSVSVPPAVPAGVPGPVSPPLMLASVSPGVPISPSLSAEASASAAPPLQPPLPPTPPPYPCQAPAQWSWSAPHSSGVTASPLP